MEYKCPVLPPTWPGFSRQERVQEGLPNNCLLLAWLTVSSLGLLVILPHYLPDQKAILQTTSVVSILSWLKHS